MINEADSIDINDIDTDDKKIHSLYHFMTEASLNWNADRQDKTNYPRTKLQHRHSHKKIISYYLSENTLAYPFLLNSFNNK